MVPFRWDVQNRNTEVEIRLMVARGLGEKKMGVTANREFLWGWWKCSRIGCGGDHTTLQTH